jgi:hypothetical protein
MNKLEISGIENLKGYKVDGWEIYHVEENERTYFMKLRPEFGYENAKHAGVVFEKNFIDAPDMGEYGGKCVKTSIMFEMRSNTIHLEEVYFNLFKTKDLLWQGIVNIIKEKGVQKYGS